MVSSFFLEEVASCNGCMTKQPRYLQLPVGEVPTKVVDQKGAFGFPAFCSYDLFCIVSFCLLCSSKSRCATLLFQMECNYKEHCVQFSDVHCLRWKVRCTNCGWWVLRKNNMVCIRKTIISGAALACRRVGSKRVKRLSSCKNNIITRQFHFDKMCC